MNCRISRKLKTTSSHLGSKRQGSKNKKCIKQERLSTRGHQPLTYDAHYETPGNRIRNHKSTTKMGFGKGECEVSGQCCENHNQAPETHKANQHHSLQLSKNLNQRNFSKLLTMPQHKQPDTPTC